MRCAGDSIGVAEYAPADFYPSLHLDSPKTFCNNVNCLETFAAAAFLVVLMLLLICLYPVFLLETMEDTKQSDFSVRMSIVVSL